MVHLGGQFPLGYDDDTLEAIQASGGGIVGTLDDAMVRLSVSLDTASSDYTTDIIDGYTWFAGPSDTMESIPGEIPPAGDARDGFAALAARQLILSEMAKHSGELGDVATLDQLHDIAIEQGIITPYSSMIVIVNSEQQRLLNRLEAEGDRYEREYEDIGETVNENPLAVTGVPEPEEWLLMGLAAAMLIWHFHKTRRQTQFAG